MLKTLSSLISTFFFFAVIAFVFLISSLWEYASQLPDYHQLAKYEPAVTTRLYAGDGRLLMEYANEKRLFVPVDKIPDKVKQAFISAEDKNFYHHAGIDYFGIARALVGNLKNIGTGRRPAGASTITQQVAKNFLLSSELSYTRKIKEAILATRMEQAFTKDHLLELYLTLDQLDIEEVAYLAALPKGPNNYNPKTKYEAAVGRRNWVIERMREEGYITEEEAAAARDKPLKVVDRGDAFIKDADYFSEEVRREISDKFGKDALYEGGLIVRTTVDPKLQEIATRVFRKELENYDLRHGYRGPLANIPLDGGYKEAMEKINLPKGAKNGWLKAVVLEVKPDKAVIETEGGSKGEIPLSLLSWARKTLKNQGVGEAPKTANKVFTPGDVIVVEKVSASVAKNKGLPENSYNLRQVPDVEGGMIVLDPHTGKVLAAVGGYDFSKSQFNRATQAKRQTGSAFKPIVYITALDNGYSPTDLILDAPFVADQGPGLPKRLGEEGASQVQKSGFRSAEPALLSAVQPLCPSRRPRWARKAAGSPLSTSSSGKSSSSSRAWAYWWPPTAETKWASLPTTTGTPSRRQTASISFTLAVELTREQVGEREVLFTSSSTPRSPAERTRAS